MRQGRPMRRQSPKARERQEAWSALTRKKIDLGYRCVDEHLSRCAGPLEGDHIDPRSLGGKWQPDNHALRCRKHHDRKHGKPWHEETAR